MKLFILVFLPFIQLFNNIIDDWKLIHSSPEVIVRYKTSDCNLDNAFKQRWFLLDFRNQSTKQVKVEWDLELFDESGKCITCNRENGEYHYSLVLQPLETKTGECKLTCSNELKIVSKLLDVKTSTSYPNFKLVNLKITGTEK